MPQGKGRAYQSAKEAQKIIKQRKQKKSSRNSTSNCKIQLRDDIT